MLDYLGSTSLVTDATGNVISEMRYKAWGETRHVSGTEQTKYTYTGQYSYASDFGLHFYNARWYDSSLSRFAQADSIIPGGVQGLDRYAYVANNPLIYIDPSGHFPQNCGPDNIYCGGLAENNYYSRPAPGSSSGGSSGGGGNSGSSTGSNPTPIESEPNWQPLLVPPQLNGFFFGSSPNPGSFEEYMANCENRISDCIIRMPLVRSHWDWSRIDWKTTGIDSVSFFATLAGLRFASDAVRNIGRGANTGSFANTFYNEYKKRDGNIASSILNTNTLLSFAGYHPVYGAIPSGISVLNDLSEGYWEETLPVYGPPRP